MINDHGNLTQKNIDSNVNTNIPKNWKSFEKYKVT